MKIPEDVEVDIEPVENYSPEKMLLYAILFRAIWDYREERLIYKKNRVKKEEEAFYVRQSEGWLFSVDTSEWSFYWICNQLGLDGNIIRKYVDK